MWYFQWTRDEKYSPRAGKIVGLSSTPGLVSVLVFNDSTLDCFNRSMHHLTQAHDVSIMPKCPEASDAKAFDQGCVLL